MKLIIMRHAEGIHNSKGLINSDVKNKDLSPLTEKGREQANHSALKLKDEKIDIIFCSEFIRTRETAEIVNKFHNVDIKIDKRLNEIDQGLEGKPNKEIENLRAESNDFFNFKIPGKESWNDMKPRFLDFLNWLSKQKYNRVLVVGHQWPLGVLRQIVEKKTNEEALGRLLHKAEFAMLDIYL